MLIILITSYYNFCQTNSSPSIKKSLSAKERDFLWPDNHHKAASQLTEIMQTEERCLEERDFTLSDKRIGLV
jgi:hypothetical protein